MILKHNCLTCLEPMNKEVSFREWWSIKTSQRPKPNCDKCTKALLKIGLARFSDIDLEIDEQKKKWIEHRDLLLKG